MLYDVSIRLSVRLSVTEVHWRIMANLGFKFRSKFTAHWDRGACRKEGRGQLNNNISWVAPLLGPLVLDCQSQVVSDEKRSFLRLPLLILNCIVEVDAEMVVSDKALTYLLVLVW